jgi:hypothetical protein
MSAFWIAIASLHQFATNARNPAGFGIVEFSVRRQLRLWRRSSWNRAAGESLHIPTFATAAGPYLSATAIKGALRTGMLFAHWRDGMLQDVLARVRGERVPRRPAEIVEEQALGPPGSNCMCFVSAGASAPIKTLGDEPGMESPVSPRFA